MVDSSSQRRVNQTWLYVRGKTRMELCAALSTRCRRNISRSTCLEITASLKKHGLLSEAAQDEFWRKRRQEGRILKKDDLPFLHEILDVLAAPKHVVQTWQSWAYPVGVDVYPNLIKCVVYWNDKCAGLKLDLCKRFRDAILESCVHRASLSIAENPGLHYCMMGLSPYFWVPGSGVQTCGWAFGDLFNKHKARIGCLFDHTTGSPPVTGKDVIQLIFRETLGCVRQYAPATLKGCLGGIYATKDEAGGAADGAKRRRTDDLRAVFGSKSSAPAETEDLCPLDQEMNEFIKLAGKYDGMPILDAYQKIISERKCPRVMHVAVFMLGLTGSNSPSEAIWSDHEHVMSGRRAKTSPKWAAAQVKIHRNYDMIRAIRQKVGAKAEQSLEEAWKAFEEASDP